MDKDIDLTQEGANVMAYVAMMHFTDIPREFLGMTDEFWEGFDKFWKEVREREASVKQDKE